jgi:DNA-binding LytR/AlgR family response regulator
MPDSTPTALIADDEPALARALAAQLACAWPALQIVHTARHGLEAAERIAALQPDLAFLDIQMPGLTGLDVAEGIEGPTRVVFVTAYDQYAVQAFDQAAVDYLLKPVHPDRLARTVQRLQGLLAQPATPLQQADQQADDGQRLLAALRRLVPGPAGSGQPPLRWVRAGVGDITHQVPVAEVLYFQADDKYTVVRTAAAEHLIRTPIAELMTRLDPAHFSQVHRSTIVNLDHLAGTRRDAASRLWLRLHGCAQELPVSRAYVHLFRAM